MGITFSTTSVAKHVESSNKKFTLYDVSRHEFSNQYERVTFSMLFQVRHVTILLFPQLQQRWRRRHAAGKYIYKLKQILLNYGSTRYGKFQLTITFSIENQFQRYPSRFVEFSCVIDNILNSEMRKCVGVFPRIECDHGF